MALLAIKNLTKEYRLKGEKIKALAGIDLEIYKGEILVIMGPSGSGKSTLLNILAGIDFNAHGSVVFQGHELIGKKRKLSLYRQKIVGIIFQSFNLMPATTVAYNIKLPRLLSSVKKSQVNFDVYTILSDLGLEGFNNKNIENLSSGEQQRVAIARALMNDPEVILADEPTGNLDTKNGERIVDILKKLNEKMGKTVIIVTHNPEIAKAGDRVIHLKDGQIESIEVINDKSQNEPLHQTNTWEKKSGNLTFIRNINLALLNLRKDFFRYLSLSLSVAIVLSALIATIFFMDVVRHNFLLSLAPASYQQTISVTRHTPVTDNKKSLPITASTIANLKNISGVRYVYPVKNIIGVIKLGTTSTPFYATTAISKTSTGSSLAASTSNTFVDPTMPVITAGSFFATDIEPSILLNKSTVDLLGVSPKQIVGQIVSLKLGNSITLAAKQQKAVNVRVVGVLSDSVEFNHNLVPANFYRTAGILDNGTYDSAYVYLNDPQNAANVNAKISALDYDSVLLSNSFLPKGDAANLYEIFLVTLAVIAILVALFSLINFLIILFNERIREVGIMKALGAMTGDIIVLYVIEGAFVGAVIGFMSLFATAGIVQLLNQLLENSYIQGQTIHTSMLITYGSSQFAWTFAISVIVGIFSIGFPAFTGSHINITKALERDL